MTSPFQRLVAALERGGYDPRSTGSDSYEARCPGHNGSRHNLSVTERDDGRVLVCCHHADESGRGCDHKAIVAALGLTEADLFPEDQARNGAAKPHANGSGNGNGKTKKKAHRTFDDVVGAILWGLRLPHKDKEADQSWAYKAHWAYPHVDGTEALRVIRLDNARGEKTYRPVHRSGDGWVTGDPAGPLPLYRAPELAKSSQWVYFAEGERCTDLVCDLGLVATTTCHGAKSPQKSDLSPLAGKDIVFLPDHDKPGEGYVRKLIGLLAKVEPPPRVRIVRLPLHNEGDDVVEWLAALPAEWGRDERRAELERLAHAAPLEDLRATKEDAAAQVRAPSDIPYSEIAGCLVHEGEEDGPQRLTNFTARIICQIERHERGVVTRQFRIEATHCDGMKAQAVVDSEHFDGMGWVSSLLGAEWTILAGRSARDHVRAAIQLLSHRDGIARATVHTSTGWAIHEGRKLFLHAAGAIGADGPTDAVRMEVNPALAQYVLPDPPTDSHALHEAVASYLRLLDLGKADRPGAQNVAVTLETLPCRAVLGPADFAVHYSGGTGTRKTSAARLAMQAFCAHLDRGDKIIASWRATPGSLQRYAFDCKDNLLVIDELTGETAVATATEFVQCQGNLKARDRMDRNFRVAASLDPRGSVLSAGEADPTRQSALGRMLSARFTPQTIDLPTLTACQADASRGQYAMVMAAYVQWLAKGDRLEEVRAEHKRLVEELTETIRAKTHGKETHPRHPGIAAELAAAYRCFLRFAVECGGVEQWSADRYAEMVERYLINLVMEQGDIQRESHPGHRFLALLAAGLSSLRYHLLDANSDNAPEPYAGDCGWHKDWLYQGNQDGQKLDWRVPVGSRCVGFIDLHEQLVYLEPEMAKTVARTMARDQGEPFENVASIGRDLAHANLIVTTKEGGVVRFTLQKRLPHRGKGRYFVLPLATLFEEGEPPSVPTVPTPLS
jgi:hypothetical protein